jgi:hypothetical protein
MAQLAVSVAGGVVGFFLGGPVGAQIGFALGSALYASQQTVKNKGPISNDLRAPKLQYGTPIPRIYGRQRVAGHLIWASAKRPVANTTSEDGKGGPTIENTTYTYEMDVKFMLYIDGMTAKAVTRVWRVGELIYSALADAGPDALEASATTDAWAEMLLRDGNPTQMPWPIYEAAVGVENAVADRWRTTVCIERLNLGGTDQMQLYEFEVITEGTPEEILGDVILQTTFEDDSAADIIDPPASMSQVGGAIDEIEPDVFALSLADDEFVKWDAEKLDMNVDDSYTFEFLVSHPGSVILDGGIFLASDLARWEFGGTTAYLAVLSTPWPPGPDPHAEMVFQTFEGEGSVATVQGAYASHVAFVVTPTGVVCYADGVAVLSNTDFKSSTLIEGGTVTLYGPNSTFGDRLGPVVFKGVRITRNALYTSNFDPPTTFGPPTPPITAWTPGVVDLADVVMAECERSNLPLERLDVSELVGKEVIGFAASGSARQVIEVLMASYYFDWCCDSALRAVLRGGAVVASIAYGDLAAGNDRSDGAAFDPQRANDEEVPAKIALTAYNLNADYEAGTEIGDRLVTVGADTRSVDLPLVMLPDQIKGRALAMALDARNAANTAQISIDDRYAEIAGSDPITVTDRDGTAYRMRVVKENYARGIKVLDLVFDDPSALVTVGIANDGRVPAISPTITARTTARYLDVPLLLDGYDIPGFMVAAAPLTADSWPGAVIQRSPDGTSYSNVATITARGVFGTAGLLEGWTGGHLYDEESVITVSVNGQLSSATRSALSADRTLNVAAIGINGRWEIVRFRNAALVATGVYQLSGFLRGKLGTEWATGLHELNDPFVLLSPTTVRHIEHSLGDIGLSRFYKAVTLGKSPVGVTPTTFTDTGVALKPYAPIDARAERDGDDITLTWRRRTRLQTRHLGPLPASVPLGEDTEAYSIDLLDSGTVVGTLTSTTSSITFDVTDYGFSPGDAIDVEIYQLSASVGRGYPLEATL